jgi:hypothetical protein
MRGMAATNREEPGALDAFLMGFLPMILYGSCVVPPAGLIIATIFVGPLFILRFVRWLNRRDDPRYAKRPPDPP